MLVRASRLFATAAAALVAALTFTAAPSPAAAAPAGGSGPRIVPMSAWDPSGTCPRPTTEETVPVERLHIHHTHRPVVTARGTTPAVLRQICSAHLGRGMSTIAYHYLVDPYGTVYQGRGTLDGAGPMPQGAHAQGFNDDSVGVALIGDFDTAAPSPAALAATAEILGWLAYTHDIAPSERVRAVSGGGTTNKFPRGWHVDLPTVAGHRDTADTACPGEHLYAKLPQLRRSVAAYIASREDPPAAAVRVPSMLELAPTTEPVARSTAVAVPVPDPGPATTAVSDTRPDDVPAAILGAAPAPIAATVTAVSAIARTVPALLGRGGTGAKPAPGGAKPAPGGAKTAGRMPLDAG